MSLTAVEIERVRRSFDQTWGISSKLADLFYSRLFASRAHFRPLFHSDMEDQKRKFISTLAVIVASLDDRAGLESIAERLAMQHLAFGVRAEHYAALGDALLWGLEQGLGPRWTPDVAEAWSKAYRMLSEHMIATAYG